MTDSPSRLPGVLAHSDVRSIIIGLFVAMLLAALDQTIVATAMPTIGQRLGDFEHLPWVVTAYLLAATAVTPLYGKISDIVGRRTTLLVAIAIFVAGSLVCALAPTMLILILARGLQGLGGGGLISLAQTIIADIVSPRERPRYQAYIAGVFVVSSIAGPVLGGFFAEHLDWSLIFWINLPLGLLAFSMTNSLLKKLPRHERPHSLDMLGAALMAAATITLMLALNWGGIRYPWASAPILGLFATSLVFSVLFILRLKSAAEPFIPAEVLANPVVAMGTLSACFGMGVFIGLTIYVPVYLETVYMLTASQSGLALIPLMCGTVAGATISGRIMARVQHYKRMPIVGLVAAIAALAVLAFAPNGLHLLALEGLLAATSIGLGSLLPVTTVAIQNAVSPHQMGTATGTMNFFRSLGGALMVAGFGAIVFSGIPQSVLAKATMENLASSISQAGLDLSGTFRWVFAAAAFGLAAALACLIIMEERPLRSHIHRESPEADHSG
jgi:EmrB/QacA subfamily drug resistance transporter